VSIGIFRLSPAIVEPLIARSIISFAVENLVALGTFEKPVLFGLIKSPRHL